MIPASSCVSCPFPLPINCIHPKEYHVSLLGLFCKYALPALGLLVVGVIVYIACSGPTIGPKIEPLPRTPAYQPVVLEPLDVERSADSLIDGPPMD